MTLVFSRVFLRDLWLFGTPTAFVFRYGMCCGPSSLLLPCLHFFAFRSVASPVLASCFARCAIVLTNLLLILSRRFAVLPLSVVRLGRSFSLVLTTVLVSILCCCVPVLALSVRFFRSVSDQFLSGALLLRPVVVLAASFRVRLCLIVLRCFLRTFSLVGFDLSRFAALFTIGALCRLVLQLSSSRFFAPLPVAVHRPVPTFCFFSIG